MPGSVRYELGIQQREDALHRLVEAWATGERRASASLRPRAFDQLDPLEKRKDAALAAAGISGMKATMRWLKALERSALELLELEAHLRGEKQEARIAELRADELVRFARSTRRRTCSARRRSSGTPASARA